MSKKTRVGVVGVGYLGQIHAKIYHEMDNVELVMLADTNLESVKELASRYGCEATDNYLELIDKVDAVSIVVPTSLHFDVAYFCVCLLHYVSSPFFVFSCRQCIFLYLVCGFLFGVV